jgi:putative peptide zinc metalloprotease protein
MVESLHSPLWYRVADLRPRLRNHVQIHRHHYRGQRWYVMQDLASGAMHRFSPAAHFFIARMDGKRTLDELWEATLERLGDDAPSQDQTIRLLGQLHAADVLQCDVLPDNLEIFQRYRQQDRAQWRQRLATPLAVRIPLLDPERFLTRCLPLVRPVFSRVGFTIWLLVVLAGLSLAGLHWSEITADIADRILTPRNLVLLWLIYPLVKILHELGHAFATRIWGGEVHELGVMFLAFIPIPYVDCSAATGFEDRRRRMIVGAAGMIVELFLAAVALFVWLNVETGIISAVAYNIMLIGGVSTLFFNGNPLLRFDGYYILADAIEIPNLGVRANRHLGYLAQRYLFGLRNAESVVMSRSECAWLVCYGIAAFLYRIAILFAILFYIAGEYFFIGLLLAVWAATTQLLLPLGRGLVFLFNSAELREQRLRTAGISGLLVAGLLWLLFFMPAPSWTRTEGVVWLPEKSLVRTDTDCFITAIVAEPGSPVTQGETVIRCEDPLLAAREAVLHAQVRELKAQYTATVVDDLVQSEGIREAIKTANAELVLVREQIDSLDIRAPGAGRLVIPKAADLVGSYVHQGDLIAYVMDGSASSARVVVPQDRISLVRQHTRNVEVRLAGYADRTIPARIQREVPAATNRLPNRALGTTGGGIFTTEPGDESGITALEKVFQFDLALDTAAPAIYFGQRVYVRFEHIGEPLARQWQRSLRQLFMRRFGA